MEIIQHGYQEINFTKEEYNAMELVKKLLRDLPKEDLESKDYEVIENISPKEIEETIDVLSKLTDGSIMTIDWE